METIVKVGQFQQVVSDDINRIGQYGRKSLDDLVASAIEPGLAYDGMNVVGLASTTGSGVVTKVTVAPGFFYSTGAVYPLGSALTLDFINDLPAVDLIIATVVAGPGGGDTSVEGRLFVKDVEGARTRYQQDVPTQNARLASIGYLKSARAAQPVAVTVDSTRVAVADVTLSPAGVVSIAMRTENQAGNVRRNANAIKALTLDVTEMQRETASIGSDVSGLARTVLGKLSIEEGNRISAALADVYAKIGLPQVYVDFGVDNCLDVSQSDATVPAYAARIEEGIRFPWAQTRQALLELANPLVVNDKITQNNGLTLPTYDENWERVIPGGSTGIVLNAFAYEDQGSLVQYQPGPYRARYGEPFTVSTASTFWNTGQYQGMFSSYGKSIFLRAGQTYQVEDTGDIDAYGAPIKRLRLIWIDSTNSPYWAGQNTPVTSHGYQWCQTLTNDRDRVVVGMGLHIYHYPAAGPLQLGICKTTTSGAPDREKLLVWKEQALGDLLASKPPQGGNRVPWRPTLLEKGNVYGALITTAADYWVTATDVANYQEGQLFYRPNLISWQDDPTKSILVDFWTALFRQSRTVVDLKPLSLAGGFTAVDILATAVIPDATSLSFEIADRTGAYKAITDLNGPDLGDVPEQAPFRIVFSGNTHLQPMIDLANSSVITARPAPALYHASDIKTLAAPANRITMTTRWESYDAAHHVVTPKLIVGNAEVAASLVTRVPDPNSPGVLVVTAVFNFGSSPISQFRRVNQATTDSIHVLCHIAKVGHVANQV